MRIKAVTSVSVWLFACALLAWSQAPAGTFKAKLDSSINTAKAKVGDPVQATATSGLKNGDTTVVRKGAKLTGRITAVSPANGSGSSSVTIVFDSAKSGGQQVALTAGVAAFLAPDSATDGDGDTGDMPSDIQIVPQNGFTAGSQVNHNGGNLNLEPGVLMQIQTGAR